MKRTWVGCWEIARSFRDIDSASQDRECPQVREEGLARLCQSRGHNVARVRGLFWSLFGGIFDDFSACAFVGNAFVFGQQEGKRDGGIAANGGQIRG